MKLDCMKSKQSCFILYSTGKKDKTTKGTKNPQRARRKVF